MKAIEVDCNSASKHTPKGRSVGAQTLDSLLLANIDIDQLPVSVIIAAHIAS